MAIRDSIRRYASDVGRAFDRAPLECILTVIVAAYMSYAIEDNHSGIGEEVAHLVIAAYLIAAIAWSATLAQAMNGITQRTRWIITLIGGIGGCLYLLLTRDIALGSEAWRAAMLVGGTTLLAIATPAWVSSGDDPSLRLRRINARVILRSAGITLYGLALFAGLSVALAAIDNLFELHIEADIYGHVFVWIMMVLVPWVVIGGLDDYVRPLDEQSDVTRVVFKLSTYLLPPLVGLYFFILLAYVVRIAMTHEMPKNLVSPMVIAAGLLSCAAMVVFDPRRDTSAGTRWMRFTPVVFIVLAPLGWWAIHVRGADYGWTEFRLFRMLLLIVLALLAVGGVTELVRRRVFSLRIIPVALACALLLAATGPWGILPIARRSQQHRLAAAFAAAKLDPRATMPRDTAMHTIPRRFYREIEGSSRYLEDNFGLEAVTAVVPRYAGSGDRGGVAPFFHLAPDSAFTSDIGKYTYASMRSGQSFATPEGIVYMYNVSGRASAADKQNAWTSRDSLFIHVGADTVMVALKPVITGIGVGERGMSYLPASGAAVPAVGTHGEQRGYTTVTNLTVKNVQGVPSIEQITGILILKGRTP